MVEKDWKLKDAMPTDFASMHPEIKPLVLQLLYNRGLTTQKQIDQFLQPDYGDDLYNPFLFSQMNVAVERIFSAIAHKEKIYVYGDYDADGVCAAAVMVEALAAFGAAVSVYIPFRETEGYGLNQEALKQIADEGTKLVITVDCGVANAAEVAYANSRGLTVIITDHHQQPAVLPEAFAIINPNVKSEIYPCKAITGAGVAFKVVQALTTLQKNYKVTQLTEGAEKWLLDLVAIGTIADLQPLLDENRVLVSYGLIVLQRTRRPGLRKLFELMGGDITKCDERTVGWQIAPRLNAAGRMNHATTAYLALTETNDAKLGEACQELMQANQNRQQVTEQIRQSANQSLAQYSSPHIMIAFGEGWPTGVIGLVAGKLTDEHQRPAFVLSNFRGNIVGSGRSTPGFNIVAALNECPDCFSRYGGHPQACGFTLKDISVLPKFVETMHAIAARALDKAPARQELSVEAEIDLNEVNWALFEDLKKFSPFGEGNPRPRLLVRGATVIETQTVGNDGKHLRLMISHRSAVVRKTIGFFFGEMHEKFQRGDLIDLVCEVDVNEWNGNRELQLKIIDIKHHE